MDEVEEEIREAAETKKQEGNRDEREGKNKTPFVDSQKFLPVSSHVVSLIGRDLNR